MKVYNIFVNGNYEGRVETSQPESDTKAWVAAGYKHPSITPDCVVLELVYEPTRSELIELL